MTVSTDDIVRHAARLLFAGTRLDLGRMAADLGISRTTFFRRAGNRDDVMGAGLRLLSDRTWQRALDRWHTTHGDAVRTPDGRLRCLWVMEEYRREVAGNDGMRKLIEAESTVALRVLTDPRGAVQPALVDQHVELFRADAEAAGLTPLVGLPDLAFAVVRLGESFLYSDVLAARTVDLAVATTLLDTLVRGALEPAASR
ncbi:QsdR family transcriptional regulator [Amycolatopsis sp. SID8362]|uniref:QsdR family transcriptional regulator n=1 Tax=Amycolatopsis sp. SID8362 TaxID=2690346 RepID=UPI0013685713|nr:QsdR family transcriptional regulator [Amycolatopsis sp. SID8362]NBH10880.1 transcriptional regulator [Amycolatopsis sp. SID8362]NED47572.1 transcriptional regulator [Amycolatopsis sp. SID8362]